MAPSACLSLFPLFNLLAVIVAGQSTATIRTNSGPVRGKVLSTVVKGTRYSAFKGIPYAKPPLGHLRFKPPVSIEPWTDTLDATTEGNACPQIDLFTKNFTGHEDCLFINVFSPLTNLMSQPASLKTVMVWIYGGSFKSGSSDTRLYGPDFLIENDVVVVSFNYRIGALGFLSMNHPNATGNAGLKDQNLALKWVRDNIARFGGNPEKVTIFGQSAGGVSVDFHVLSNRSRGLFKRAISMSGSPMNPWGFHVPEQAEKLSRQFGNLLTDEYLSNGDNLLNFLYGVSAYDLVMAGEKLSTVLPAFRPTIEDPKVAGKKAFITECSVKKYSSRQFNRVPYLMGVTSEETVSFAAAVQPILEIIDLALTTAESIGMKLPSSLIIFKNLISSTSSVIDGVSKLALQAVVHETTDLLFKFGIDEKQRTLVANSPEPVYYYQISFDPSVSLHKIFFDININGAGHGDELAYIFYIPAANLPLDSSHPISITRNRMTRMWTNFAKYGNPTPNGTNDPILNITWPASGSSGTRLEIDNELSIDGRPINANVALMQLLGAPTAAARSGCPITMLGSLFKSFSLI